MDKDRFELFEDVKKFLSYCCDTVTKEEKGNVIEKGTCIFNNENEMVDFSYDEKSNVIHLNINNEQVLEIAKDSPILEAFQELFYQISPLD